MHLSALQEDLEFIARYDLPYEQLKGKNILVTGATGLIGASLVRALLAIGDIGVIALVRSIDKAKRIFGESIDSSLKLYVADVVNEIHIDESVDYISLCISNGFKNND